MTFNDYTTHWRSVIQTSHLLNENHHWLMCQEDFEITIHLATIEFVRVGILKQFRLRIMTKRYFQNRVCPSKFLHQMSVLYKTTHKCRNNPIQHSEWCKIFVIWQLQYSNLFTVCKKVMWLILPCYMEWLIIK